MCLKALNKTWVGRQANGYSLEGPTGVVQRFWMAPIGTYSQKGVRAPEKVWLNTLKTDRVRQRKNVNFEMVHLTKLIFHLDSISIPKNPM